MAKQLQEIKENLTSTVCGTPIQMAPETLRQNAYSYKVDIWAIGITFYELLTGLKPFNGRNFSEFR